MLGLLLHSKPGCGKTSSLKAIANMTQSVISVLLDDNKTRQLRALSQDEQVHVANADGMGGYDTFRMPLQQEAVRARGEGMLGGCTWSAQDF